MKTALELFLVSRVTEGFHIVRKQLDMTQENRDPDAVADEYIQFLFRDSQVIVDKERYILHSTSWRYETPRAIVLTYMVYADTFSFQHLNPFLLKNEELQVTHSDNPKIPRPKTLTQKAIISHGLRHLAFLLEMDTKGIYKNVLSNETQQVFKLLGQQLAGKIS